MHWGNFHVLEFGMIPELYYKVRKKRLILCAICCHMYKGKNTFVNLYIQKLWEDTEKGNNGCLSRGKLGVGIRRDRETFYMLFCTF